MIISEIESAWRMKMKEFDDVLIRPFASRDAKSCFKIRSKIFIKSYYDDIGSDAVVMGVNAYLPDSFIAMAENMPIFVAQSKETSECIGFIAPRILKDIENAVEILFLYVDPDHQRSGVATKLVDYFEDWMITSHPHIDRIIIDSAMPKYNQAFYEKVGFKVIGYNVARYTTGKVRSLCMAKEL